MSDAPTPTRILHRNWLTPVVTVLALAICVSGVLMFLHLAPGGLRALHEWAGLAFVVAVILHLALNFRALVGYFRSRLGLAAGVAALAGCGLIVAFGASSGHDEGGHRRERTHGDRGSRARGDGERDDGARGPIARGRGARGHGRRAHQP